MTRFTPKKAGIYLITANLLVSLSAASHFHAMIVVDGRSSQFSGGQNYQRAFTFPSTPWQFTVPVSCSLKLTTSQYVSIYVDVNVAYSILGNSTLSVALIASSTNPQRGGMSAVALLDTILYDKFSVFKNWKYSTSDHSDAYGVYKDHINFVKTAQLKEYIQIENSGIYFLEVAAKLESKNSFGPFTLALCLMPNTVLPFRTIKQSDGSSNSDNFGIALYAVLYLTRGQQIYLCLAGQPNKYFIIIKNYAGFSATRIVPRVNNPGLRQMSNALTSSSRDWIVVSDWTSGAISSLYKRGEISSAGADDLTVSEGTYFISSSLSSITNSTKEICVTSSNCDVCYLHATFTNGGINQALILHDDQSLKTYKTCTKQFSGGVTRSAQFLPYANVNTSFYYRHDKLSFSGEKTLTSWISEDNQTHSNIAANVQGLYIVTLNIVLKSTSNSRINASVYWNTNAFTSVLVPGLYVPVTWSKANEAMAFGLASLIRMEKEQTLNVKVFSGELYMIWKDVVLLGNIPVYY